MRDVAELYSRSVSLFDLDMDRVLRDTSNLEGRRANGSAEFGFSKNKSPVRVRIIVGVLMSRDGFPIAHEVFPRGHTAERRRSVRRCGSSESGSTLPW